MPFTFDSAPLHSSLTVAVASHARHRVLFRSPALACIRRRTLVAASRIIISSPTHIDPESLTIAYCLTSSPHCPRTSITPYPPSVHHIAIFFVLLPSTPSGALSTFPLCELYDNVRFPMAVRRTRCCHHTTRLLSCSSVRSHMHSPRTRIYTHTRLVSPHDYILLAAIGFRFHAMSCLISVLSMSHAIFGASVRIATPPPSTYRNLPITHSRARSPTPALRQYSTCQARTFATPLPSNRPVRKNPLMLRPHDFFQVPPRHLTRYLSH